jgi:hypothetical protein
LLVINKSATTDLTESIQLNGFRPGATANVWQYGKAEDIAQSQTTDGHAALTSATPTLVVGPTGVSYTFPAYSMTVIELAPAPPAEVVARSVFYNQSAFDGNDASASASDDAAIATDKAALLPGETAGAANYTSYSRGLNGIMVDVANLPPGAGPGMSSFSFRAGNGGDPSTWVIGPSPSLITVRRGAGARGSDRVKLVWETGAVKNGWLQVTMHSDATTGLAAPDVFYFGNLVGETGDAASPGRVSALDLAGVKRGLNTAAPITSPLDFNRDGRVNALDLAAVKASLFRSLTAITAPLAALVTARRRTDLSP